jgi:hypothetical protein
MADAKSVIPDARPGTPARAPRQARRWRGEFFSLGGLLAPYATSRLALAPWAFSAGLLTALAFSDPVLRDGEVDAILVGLAAYELLIGLTRDSDRASAPGALKCGSPEASTS